MATKIGINHTTSYTIKTDDGFNFKIPLFAKHTSNIWKPLLSYLTYMNIFNFDSNLKNIFLDNYESLMDRIRNVSNIMEAPLLAHIEVILDISPKQIRSYNLKRIIDNLEQWWENFLKEFRTISNERLRDLFNFTNINDKDWEDLREKQEEKIDNYRKKYSAQFLEENAGIYQSLIFNRETFLKTLNNVLNDNLETIKQIYNEKKTQPALTQAKLFTEDEILSYVAPKVQPIVEEKVEFEGWLTSLSPNDQQFVLELLDKLNRFQKVAPYKYAKKLGISRKKVDYFCSLLMQNITTIERDESILDQQHSLILTDKTWLILNKNNITSPALNFMAENFSDKLSQTDMERIYKGRKGKWIIHRMKMLEKTIPALKLIIEEKSIILLKLNKLRLPKQEKIEISDIKDRKRYTECKICPHFKALDVFKGNRLRGRKFYCIASDVRIPKEITKPTEVPNWCPLEKGREITMSKYFNCEKCRPNIQRRRNTGLQCSCELTNKCECFT